MREYGTIKWLIGVLVEKSITFFRTLGEYGRLFLIFPADAP